MRLSSRGGSRRRHDGHIRESGASAVMHFAAWLSVPDSVRDPAGCYRNNVTGTIGTLEAMAAERLPTIRVFIDLRGLR